MGLHISWPEFKEQMRKVACRWCAYAKEPDRKVSKCMDGCFSDYIKHCLEMEALKEKGK
jgi:hypothetical protein